MQQSASVSSFFESYSFQAGRLGRVRRGRGFEPRRGGIFIPRYLCNRRLRISEQKSMRERGGGVERFSRRKIEGKSTARKRKRLGKSETTQNRPLVRRTPVGRLVRPAREVEADVRKKMGDDKTRSRRATEGFTDTKQQCAVCLVAYSWYFASSSRTG